MGLRSGLCANQSSSATSNSASHACLDLSLCRNHFFNQFPQSWKFQNVLLSMIYRCGLMLLSIACLFFIRPVIKHLTLSSTAFYEQGLIQEWHFSFTALTQYPNVSIVHCENSTNELQFFPSKWRRTGSVCFQSTVFKYNFQMLCDSKYQ